MDTSGINVFNEKATINYWQKFANTNHHFTMKHQKWVKDHSKHLK